MLKSSLETFIKKYNLNGNINGARWKVDAKAKTLVASGISDDQQILFEVTLKEFSELTDVVFGVYNTSKLKQMIGVLSDEVSVDLLTKKNRLATMSLTDSMIDVQYALAELAVIPEKPALKVTPEYNVEIDFNEDFINRFIKAKNALNDVDTFTLSMGKNGKLQMSIGHINANNSNKIIIVPPTKNEKDTVSEPIHFNAKYLKEILVNNSESDSSTLYVSDIGLAKIEFDKDLFSSNYYLVNIKNVD
jgi:hypothetical protein